jgi:hypothetical protein
MLEIVFYAVFLPLTAKPPLLLFVFKVESHFRTNLNFGPFFLLNGTVIVCFSIPANRFSFDCNRFFGGVIVIDKVPTSGTLIPLGKENTNSPSLLVCTFAIGSSSGSSSTKTSAPGTGSPTSGGEKENNPETKSKIEASKIFDFIFSGFKVNDSLIFDLYTIKRTMNFNVSKILTVFKSSSPNIYAQNSPIL